MNRKELFEQGRKIFVEKQEKSREGFSADYEDIKYSALDVDKFSFIRMLGLPIDVRQDDVTSPKLIQMSWILDDKGKNFRCIWPLEKESKEWPLWKIFRKVTSYTWDKAKNQPVYLNADKYPDIFNRVAKNNKIDNPYEKGWKPTKHVVANVIDRAMMDWHKENKHTVLLSKKESILSDDRSMFEPGFPEMILKNIMNYIVTYAGDWEDYDIVIRKLDEAPYYEVFHAEEDKKKYIGHRTIEQFLSDYPFYSDEYHSRPLTEEEQSWERYDIDKLFPVTSNVKILNRLGDFIKQIDSVFHQHYYDELSVLAEKQKKEYAEKYGDNDDNDELTEQSESLVKEFKDDSIELTTKKEDSPVRERQSSSTKDKFFADTLDPEKFKGIKHLTKENKKIITGYDEENDTLEYSLPDGVELYKCINKTSCSCLSPDTFDYCPMCGICFDDE